MGKLKENEVWSYYDEGKDDKFYTFIGKNISKSKFVKLCQNNCSGWVSEGWIKSRVMVTKKENYLDLFKTHHTSNFIGLRKDEPFSDISEVFVIINVE
jgi:hypothetical protein